MKIFEAGGFLGIIGGAVVGAILCRSHGTLAEVAGAVGGGIGGMVIGTLFGYVSCIVYAFARALAKIYWEVLTGRRKLPSISSTPVTHRRRLLAFIAIICIVAELLLATIYFVGSEAERSRVPIAAVCVFGVCLVGLLILVVRYHLHPFQKESGRHE